MIPPVVLREVSSSFPPLSRSPPAVVSSSGPQQLSPAGGPQRAPAPGRAPQQWPQRVVPNSTPSSAPLQWHPAESPAADSKCGPQQWPQRVVPNSNPQQCTPPVAPSRVPSSGLQMRHPALAPSTGPQRVVPSGPRPPAAVAPNCNSSSGPSGWSRSPAVVPSGQWSPAAAVSGPTPTIPRPADGNLNGIPRPADGNLNGTHTTWRDAEVGGGVTWRRRAAQRGTWVQNRRPRCVAPVAPTVRSTCRDFKTQVANLVATLTPLLSLMDVH
jgi:hypothetical protein